MQDNREKCRELAARIYELDGEVYRCVGSSLGRTFTGNKETTIKSLADMMYTRPQGHLLRSELALINNMARTIPDVKDRHRLLDEYAQILKANGAELGITEPYQMFWVTGALSSFLDNTPTYLVFLTTAGTLGFQNGIATALGTISVPALTAISCGAVFMGANTYIGNAPNFMVKAIADENGIRMPSFFGYLLWSLAVLVPVFILDTLVFFL